MKEYAVLSFIILPQIILGLSTENLELDYETAEQLSGLPLECAGTEYPNKLSQLIRNESDILPPSQLHPIFYGCFDWHSSVHGHWLLSKVANLFPDGEVVANITDLFQDQFQEDKVEVEVGYFDGDPLFERTYGWSWFLKLHQELSKSSNVEMNGHAVTLQPIADLLVTKYKEYLPKLVYPIRSGTHSNTAFGLSFALDYVRYKGDTELEELIIHNTTSFYKEDWNCPIYYEPSGSDFLSPCLMEADLMTRVLSEPTEYLAWLENFLPQLLNKDFDLEPAEVIDRTDGHLVHLDGLNFSRAWALYNMAIKLPDEKGAHLIPIADNHIKTSIDQVVGSDYAGSHWLASFLLYSLERRSEAMEVTSL